MHIKQSTCTTAVTPRLTCRHTDKCNSLSLNTTPTLLPGCLRPYLKSIANPVRGLLYFRIVRSTSCRESCGEGAKHTLHRIAPNKHTMLTSNNSESISLYLCFSRQSMICSSISLSLSISLCLSLRNNKQQQIHDRQSWGTNQEIAELSCGRNIGRIQGPRCRALPCSPEPITP